MHDQSVFSVRRMLSKGIPWNRLGVLKEMWPLALSMTGAVNTSPSGRLHSPAHGMAGSPLMEKEMSVPGPVIFTYSAFSIMAASFRMAGRRAA